MSVCVRPVCAVYKTGYTVNYYYETKESNLQTWKLSESVTPAKAGHSIRLLVNWLQLVVVRSQLRI